MIEKLIIKAKSEPLCLLIDKYGVDVSQIKAVATGLRYTAVMLNNGNIGVCANLGNQVTLSEQELNNPDLDNIQHRILLNAYFGASLNYFDDGKKEGDIFDAINFKSYSTVVMIGLFRPVVKKFRDEGIPLSVFDISKNDPVLVPLTRQLSYLHKADAIILSSTTVFNNTFMSILQNVNVSCEIFMLGPSSIMSQEMLDYGNVRFIFGSVFKNFDEGVLIIIQNGGGTKEFQPLGRKVYLIYKIER